MVGLSRRGVQISLGILWLLDGALQLQHQMFSSAFATQVIDPAIQGQPRFVSGPMNFGVHLFLLHPAVFNALFALTQLGIGVFILWKRTVKWGLLSSVLWGLIVWIFGEGYGGIFSAHTLLLMGAPGAVILYAILALAVMPSNKDDKHQKKQQPAYWLVFVWIALWVGGGVYQLLPGQNTTTDVSSMITGNSQGAPGWLASIDNHTANVINGFGETKHSSSASNSSSSNMGMTGAQMAHMSNEPYTSTSQSDSGYWFILLLAALQFCIGFGVLLSGIWRKLAISLGIVLSLAFWVVGQSLGAYFTGLATDPSTGPLFLLLGLAILGCTSLNEILSKLAYKIECVIAGKPDSNHQNKHVKPNTKQNRFA